VVETGAFHSVARRPGALAGIGLTGFTRMKDFLTAIGLVLVIEGSLYALMPEAMKRLMEQAKSVPTPLFRTAGLAAATTGVLLVWWLRRQAT